MQNTFAEAELKDIRQKEDHLAARGNQETFDHLPDDQKNVIIDSLHDVALRAEEKMRRQRIHLRCESNRKKNTIQRSKKHRKMQKISRKRNR